MLTAYQHTVIHSFTIRLIPHFSVTNYFRPLYCYLFTLRFAGCALLSYNHASFILYFVPIALSYNYTPHFWRYLNDCTSLRLYSIPIVLSHDYTLLQLCGFVLSELCGHYCPSLKLKYIVWCYYVSIFLFAVITHIFCHVFNNFHVFNLYRTFLFTIVIHMLRCFFNTVHISNIVYHTTSIYNARCLNTYCLWEVVYSALFSFTTSSVYLCRLLCLFGLNIYTLSFIHLRLVVILTLLIMLYVASTNYF